MITQAQAREIAYREITAPRPFGSHHLEVAINDKSTCEYEFGWVFFWNSKQYLETGDILTMLCGNAPLIVNKEDGSAYFTGTASPIEHYVEEYRRKLKSDAFRSL